MSRFKVKNRKKRKYSKRNTSDASFYASVPLLVGFLPAMIVVIAFIIVPVITFKPFPPQILTILSQLLSEVNNKVGATYYFIYHLLTFVHLPHLPSFSIGFPEITIDFSPVAYFVTQCYSRLEELLQLMLQTRNVSFFALLFIGKTLIDISLWIFNTLITLGVLGWNGLVIAITEIGNSILNFFTSIIQTIAFVIIGLENLTLNIFTTTGQSITNVWSFLIHFFISVMYEVGLIAREIISILMRITSFMSSFIIATGMFIIHIIAWPFVLFGKLMAALHPYILMIMNIFTRAWKDMNNSFATTFSLTGELMKQFPKK